MGELYVAARVRSLDYNVIFGGYDIGLMRNYACTSFNHHYLLGGLLDWEIQRIIRWIQFVFSRAVVGLGSHVAGATPRHGSL